MEATCPGPSTDGCSLRNVHWTISPKRSRPPARGCPRRGRGSLESTTKLFLVYLLPKEIIERVAAGVDFSDHFVEVSTEFVDADFVTC